MIFCASLTAKKEIAGEHVTAIDIHTAAYFTGCVSEAEAVGRAYIMANKRWPAEEGWKGHSVVVLEVKIERENLDDC